MRQVKNIRLLENQLATTNSIRGALFVLKNFGKAFGNCHMAYEFMLQPKAFIRGDHINITTLPAAIYDTYLPSGGANSDPVIEKIATMNAPEYVDIEQVCKGSKLKFYQNPFFLKLLDIGCVSFAAYPILLDRADRFGILTVFETAEQRKNALDADYYLDAALVFHRAISKFGQLGRYFGVNEKERFVLEKMALGKNALDVSDELEITQRTVENRLQSARLKLKARTTTEAVYKASAYQIIFRKLC